LRELTQLVLVKGDANFNLKFTIYDQDDTLVDLSNSIPYLKIQKYGESTVAVTYTGNSISTGTAGQCTIPVSTVSLDEGDYIAEIEIVYSTGKILTVPDIEVLVKEQLPKSW